MRARSVHAAGERARRTRRKSCQGPDPPTVLAQPHPPRATPPSCDAQFANMETPQRVCWECYLVINREEFENRNAERVVRVADFIAGSLPPFVQVTEDTAVSLPLLRDRPSLARDVTVTSP